MMIRADKNFCDLMLSSSCFGREACPSPPCACAQSLIDRSIAMVMERLADHYWDSFEANKELILKHVRGALAAELNEDPSGQQREPTQIGWMGDISGTPFGPSDR